MAWAGILRAIAVALPDVILRRRAMPPLFPEGGRYGLPADFLVSPDGIVLAAHYGEHADDQWSVDTVLLLAARHKANRLQECPSENKPVPHDPDRSTDAVAPAI
jgi:hypothetical protein